MTSHVPPRPRPSGILICISGDLTPLASTLDDCLTVCSSILSMLACDVASISGGTGTSCRCVWELGGADIIEPGCWEPGGLDNVEPACAGCVCSFKRLGDTAPPKLLPLNPSKARPNFLDPKNLLGLEESSFWSSSLAPMLVLDVPSLG
jgi:hypothetical protein